MMLRLGVSAVLLAGATGCASLASPFDQMKESQMTVYRLQNYEPPSVPAGQPPVAAGPTLPPQIQQWITGAAQLLPPGLLPPGLIPGAAPSPTAPAAQTAKFHDFRIIDYRQVQDGDTKKSVAELFGKSGNFSEKFDNCFYAEFGFAIANPQGGTADILVSLSCNQVRPYNFQWPHSKYGLTDDFHKKVAAIAQSAFKAQ